MNTPIRSNGLDTPPPTASASSRGSAQRKDAELDICDTAFEQFVESYRSRKRKLDECDDWKARFEQMKRDLAAKTEQLDEGLQREKRCHDLADDRMQRLSREEQVNQDLLADTKRLEKENTILRMESARSRNPRVDWWKRIGD